MIFLQDACSEHKYIDNKHTENTLNYLGAGGAQRRVTLKHISTWEGLKCTPLSDA